MATHYETLGVAKTATSDEIRRAYHVQARRWHPDRAGDRTPDDVHRAEDAMRRVNEAWRVLSNERRRREYDLVLDLGHGTNGATRPTATATDEPSGSPRIDPRLLDPEYLAARRRAQVEHIERGHAAVLRSLPWIAVLGFLLAIVIFSAYQGGPGDDEGEVVGPTGSAAIPATNTVPLPSIGVPAGSCVRVLSGPSLQEVPCDGPRDGVVVGVKLDPEAACPAPADQEVPLRNGAIVCLSA